MGAGFYTSDGTLTIKINQYNGYQELTCAQVLQAIKDTDSYNQDAIGFIGVGTSNGEGYEVAPFNISSATELYIRNNADGKSEENYDFVCWYGVNPTTINVRSYQYFRAQFSNNQWTFGGYRSRSSSNYTYGGNTYNGTLAEGLYYTSSFLYLEHPENFGTVYFNGVAPVTYTWQSVPTISGKNGILQNLVQLKNSAINSGEPVSNASLTSFDSLGNINIPSVIDGQMPVDPSDVTSVTATYLIPALENGTYEGIKLLVKKGSIPTSEQDADKVVNLDEPTSILRIDSKSVGNLDEDSHYYFVVKLVDEIGTEATSEPKDIWTSHDEGSSFDYTGQIQTFVAPQTGIYSLETWGAQGGNATDGTNTARGGYGAYAYGEMLLQQGETIYINVGGQNGYGGGGWYKDILSSILDNNVFNSQYGATMGYYAFENLITYFPDILPYLGTEKCILVGQINRHPFYNQDNYFVHAQEYEDYDVNATLLIPLGEVKYISNLTCEYMIQKLENTGYNWYRVYGINIDTTTGEVIDKAEIFLDTENRSISWTTVSANVNKSLNYIILFCTSGTVKIRNLRIQ